MIYRYVDILNELGHEAYVLHHKRNFRASWFRNRTPIAYAKNGWRLTGPNSLITRKIYDLTGFWPFPRKIYLSNGQSTTLMDTDYLLLPAILAESYFKCELNAKVVILNQNAYTMTFKRPGVFPKGESSWFKKDIQGILTVSEDNQQYLSHAFPDLKVYLHRYSVNPDIFHFTRGKKNVISFMPRKNSEHARQVINMLKTLGSVKEFEIIAIDKMLESQVGKILRDSLIFLSFGSLEGFGLPPAEAMACGCVVIGYDGIGGKEFFQKDFSYPIEIGDINSFVQTIEFMVQRYREEPDIVLNIGKKASQFISRKYSPEMEKKSVKESWENIINDCASGLVTDAGHN